jgi:hypothetical protein
MGLSWQTKRQSRAAPNPTYFFVLTQKSMQKKHLTRPTDTLSNLYAPTGTFPKRERNRSFLVSGEGKKELKCLTSPASLEKLVVRRLKTFKLAPTEYAGTQTQKFSSPTSLHFSTHRTRSVRLSIVADKINYSISIHYKTIFFFVMF